MKRIAIALLLSLATACSDRVGDGWDWGRMRSQPRYEPYGRGAAFRDGKAMQRAPLGTLSRESDDSAAAMPADLARGAERFAIYCAVCHGERGDGVSLVASNMDPPRPPSLLDAPRRALSAAQIYAVATHGFGRMPPLASALSASDRWAVAAYVGALQRGAVARP